MVPGRELAGAPPSIGCDRLLDPGGRAALLAGRAERPALEARAAVSLVDRVEEVERRQRRLAVREVDELRVDLRLRLFVDGRHVLDAGVAGAADRVDLPADLVDEHLQRPEQGRPEGVRRLDTLFLEGRLPGAVEGIPDRLL